MLTAEEAKGLVMLIAIVLVALAVLGSIGPTDKGQDYF